MTIELGNSHMFLAYHIRSASLMFEAALREILNEKELSSEHFYILRCDWISSELTLDDLMSHAILPKKETIQAVNDLVAQDYVIKGKKDEAYVLSPLGVSIRDQVLKAYHAHISKAMQGLSDKSVEAALSSLLTVQNNIQGM